MSAILTVRLAEGMVGVLQVILTMYGVLGLDVPSSFMFLSVTTPSFAVAVDGESVTSVSSVVTTQVVEESNVATLPLASRMSRTSPSRTSTKSR